jgi:lysophospholipase L1-like esterase
MQGAKPDDPIAYPGISDAVLAKFPATLLLTGTRAYDMSATIVAHSKLLKLGVDSQLYVLEGGWHGAHVMAAGTPEAHDANAYVARWFDQRLGTKALDEQPATTLEERLQMQVDSIVAADKHSPPTPCQVLFVGSSSFAAWKSLQKDMAPLRVVNRGFGSLQIEHVNRWFAQIVAPYRPNAIVFYAGENDIDAGKPIERVLADFDTFMKLKDDALGNVPVYFISLKPSKARFDEIERQSAVNRAIRAQSDARDDLYYIDVAESMLQDGKPKDLFLGDNLHMTPQGYAIWTAAVRAAILPNAKSRALACYHQALTQ